MQTNNKLQELINKFNTNKNVTEEDITLLKSIATDLKISQKRVGLNYDHSQLDPEDASNLLQGNKLFFENKSDLNISFNEKGMTNNALIEGDNFYALSKMKDMGKKFEVIYIDPPYNTGNDDLGYEDKRIGSEDGFKHSKWLAFMEPRLKLAQQLLTDDGVIFVSIDDHEQAYLKVMMDKIFGERNFISNLIWEKTTHVGKQKLNVYSKTEYVLTYAKNKIDSNLGTRRLLIDSIQSEFIDAPLFNKGNKEQAIVFKKESIYFNLKDGLYKKTNNNNFKLLNNINIINNKSDRDVIISFKSRWSQKTIDENFNRGDKFIIKSEDFSPRVIYSNKKDIFYNSVSSLLPRELVSFTENGTKQLINILENNSFGYPKPTNLIKYLIKTVTQFNKNAHVLDFFAGTGTTGQAVLELNQEDGGHRQFTLVTSKEREDNIARTITYKRLSKVINGYTTTKGKEVDGIHANLSYYLADIEQLVPEDEVDFGMVDDAVINEDKASTYAIKENAVLIKKFNDSTFLFKVRDHQFTLIGEGLQDDLKLNKYVQKDDELLIYDLGLDSKQVHEIEKEFNVQSVINLDDTRLPKYLDIEL